MAIPCLEAQVRFLLHCTWVMFISLFYHWSPKAITELRWNDDSVRRGCQILAAHFGFRVAMVE